MNKIDTFDENLTLHEQKSEKQRDKIEERDWINFYAHIACPLIVTFLKEL